MHMYLVWFMFGKLLYIIYLLNDIHWILLILIMLYINYYSILE